MAMRESSPKRRRRLSAPARRDQLLDVTTELVIEDGFQGVSIESVAQRANVARSLVYKHFADRAELLDAVVEREAAHALTQVSETTLTDLSQGPPRELMLESLRAYLHVVRSHPMTWRLVLMPPQGAPEILRERVEAGRAAVLGRLIEAVRPALRSESETLDAELTARILSALADEYARLILADPERFPAERLLDHARWILEQGRTDEIQLRRSEDDGHY